MRETTVLALLCVAQQLSTTSHRAFRTLFKLTEPVETGLAPGICLVCLLTGCSHIIIGKALRPTLRSSRYFLVDKRSPSNLLRPHSSQLLVESILQTRAQQGPPSLQLSLSSDQAGRGQQQSAKQARHKPVTNGRVRCTKCRSS